MKKRKNAKGANKIVNNNTTGDASEGFHDERHLRARSRRYGRNILHFASELKRGMENASGRTRLLE